MNERLKELKEEALVWATETLDPDELNDYEWSVAIDEKFAELIVQECADLCERFGESGDGYTCSAEILEHFGVEE